MVTENERIFTKEKPLTYLTRFPKDILGSWSESFGSVLRIYLCSPHFQSVHLVSLGKTNSREIKTTAPTFHRHSSSSAPPPLLRQSEVCLWSIAPGKDNSLQITSMSLCRSLHNETFLKVLMGRSVFQGWSLLPQQTVSWLSPVTSSWPQGRWESQHMSVSPESVTVWRETVCPSDLWDAIEHLPS